METSQTHLKAQLKDLLLCATNLCYYHCQCIGNCFKSSRISRLALPLLSSTILELQETWSKQVSSSFAFTPPTSVPGHSLSFVKSWEYQLNVKTVFCQVNEKQITASSYSCCSIPTFISLQSKAEQEAENMEWSTSSRALWLLEATARSWQTIKKAQKSDSGLPRGKGETEWDQTPPVR